MQFQKALDAYMQWLRVERNLAPRTREAYRYDLERFQAWLQEVLGRDELGLCNQEVIQDYLRHLRDDLLCKSPTVNRCFASLEGFFAHATREGWIPENPFQLLSRSKLPQKLPVYLSEEELNRLFSVPDVSTVKGARDFAILKTLGYGGLRVSELVGINTQHLDFSGDTLRVFGKGRKERLVPLNALLVTAIRQYLEHPDRVPAPEEKALFLNQRGGRLSVRAVQYLVDEYALAAGLDKDALSPHKLRHTFATLLHSRDVDLIDIQALLGHASLASTQIYTHTDTRRLKQTIALLDFEGK